MGTGYPGFQGLGLAEQRSRTGLDEPYIYHFPTVMRRSRGCWCAVIPSVAGGSMEDIVTARFDYREARSGEFSGTPTPRQHRGHVRNRSDGKADVGYVRDGRLHRVRRRNVYAGYGRMLP